MTAAVQRVSRSADQAAGRLISRHSAPRPSLKPSTITAARGTSSMMPRYPTARARRPQAPHGYVRWRAAAGGVGGRLESCRPPAASATDLLPVLTPLHLL